MNIFKELFKQITNFGGLIFYLFILLLTFSFNYYYETFYLFLMLIGAFIVTYLIRSIYFVNRPKKQKYDNFIEKLDASSFPSLHSMRVSILTLFFINFSENFVAKIFIIVFGLLVVYSRIFLKKHRFIDVLFGIIFGFIIYYLIMLI